MFRWTQDQIRFLEDAARTTEYHRLLAAQLAELLPKDAKICDVGCGLGHLSELLCASFSRVTAVDCSETAIDAFRARLGEKTPENLEIFCADAFSLPQDLRFDAMIFCYFGSLPDVLRIARRHCEGSVVIVRRNYGTHRFDLGGHPRLRASASDTLETLRSLGIRCERVTLAPEFGQPLRSVEDAVQFFRLYRRDPAQEIRAEEVVKRLVKTGDPEFPYYFPQKKDVSILRFDAAQIPE